jgi:hypothetical protein
VLEQGTTAAVWVSRWVSTPLITRGSPDCDDTRWAAGACSTMVVIAVLSLDRKGGTHRRVSGQDSDGYLLAQAPMRSRTPTGECSEPRSGPNRQIPLKTRSQSVAESGTTAAGLAYILTVSRQRLYEYSTTATAMTLGRSRSMARLPRRRVAGEVLGRAAT